MIERQIKVCVDLMGGDRAPRALFEAILALCPYLRPTQRLLLLVQEERYAELGVDASLPPQIEVMPVEESIEMSDAPLYAVRKKRLSSMAIGMEFLKQKEVDALVSTGNTGALVAMAQITLPLLETIEKPALLVTLPSEKGEVVVLDVGAHISFKPQHLLDYARLGVAYSQVIYENPLPTLGLLNIGVEEMKGTKEVQEVYITLQNAFSREQFVGNVEGREVFQGRVDVLVTDGFTGNVFLKTCEGASSFLLEYMHNYFSSLPASGGEKLMHHFQQRFNYSAHRGALLCGVEGVVIKCHGNASDPAFVNGIERAFELAERQIDLEMQKKLREI